MKNIYITGGLGQDGIILKDIFLQKKEFQLFIYGKKKKNLSKPLNAIALALG